MSSHAEGASKEPHRPTPADLAHLHGTHKTTSARENGPGEPVAPETATQKEVVPASVPAWDNAITGRTELLHWCDAMRSGYILDGGAVQPGKQVRMRADWLAGYSQPKVFTIHEEAFLLKRMFRRMGGSWHPMNPFQAHTPIPGMTLSRDHWTTGVSNVTKQTHYYFKDDQGHASGRLTVSGATAWVGTSSYVVNGLEVKLSPGIGVGINTDAGHHMITHGVGATRDPRLRVELLTPTGNGELNLLGHVRRLIEERLRSPELVKLDGEKSGFDDISHDDVLIDASDGYLSPKSPWMARLAPDSGEIVVDELRPASVNVEIPTLNKFDTPFRTAYALRLVDVDDPANFVISGIVLIDYDGDSVRVHG